MLKIALTGGIGSGKSTVAKMFSQLGIDVIDSDQIARDVVQPGTAALEKIIQHFGHDIIDNQQLNRNKLRTLVFEQAKEKQWLENLLHPLIRQQITQQLEQVTSPYCLIVIPLLVEAKTSKEMYDRVLVVDTTEALQIQRAQQRDQSTKDEITAILKSQASREQRLAIADDVIDNSKDVNLLKQKVNILNNFYLTIAKKSA